MAPLSNVAVAGGVALLATHLHGCGGDDDNSSSDDGVKTTTLRPANVTTTAAPVTTKYPYVPDTKIEHCIPENALDAVKNRPKAKGFYLYRLQKMHDYQKYDLLSNNLNDYVANVKYLMTEVARTSVTAANTAVGQWGDGHCHRHYGINIIARYWFEYSVEGVDEQALSPDSVFGGFVADDKTQVTTFGKYLKPNDAATFDPPIVDADGAPAKVQTFSGDAVGSPGYKFERGYAMGCQTQPGGHSGIWYSTVAELPQYPIGMKIPSYGNYTQVKAQSKDWAGGRCMSFNEAGDVTGPQGSPWTDYSKTCVWKSTKAGYITVDQVEDVPKTITVDGHSKNIENTYDHLAGNFTEWCMVNLPEPVPVTDLPKLPLYADLQVGGKCALEKNWRDNLTEVMKRQCFIDWITNAGTRIADLFNEKYDTISGKKCIKDCHGSNVDQSVCAAVPHCPN